MWRFMGDKSKEIGSVTSIVNTIFIVCGSLFAGYQLYMAHLQLYEAKRAIENSNAYNIQKDARLFLDSFIKDDDIYSILSNKLPEDGEVRRRQLYKVGYYINFFYDVYVLGKRSSLPDGIYKDFGKDFCQFIESDSAILRHYWKSALSNPITSEKYGEMRDDWCA